MRTAILQKKYSAWLKKRFYLNPQDIQVNITSVLNLAEHLPDSLTFTDVHHILRGEVPDSTGVLLGLPHDQQTCLLLYHQFAVEHRVEVLAATDLLMGKRQTGQVRAQEVVFMQAYAAYLDNLGLTVSTVSQYASVVRATLRRLRSGQVDPNVASFRGYIRTKSAARQYITSWKHFSRFLEVYQGPSARVWNADWNCLLTHELPEPSQRRTWDISRPLVHFVQMVSRLHWPMEVVNALTWGRLIYREKEILALKPGFYPTYDRRGNVQGLCALAAISKSEDIETFGRYREYACPDHTEIPLVESKFRSGLAMSLVRLRRIRQRRYKSDDLYDPAWMEPVAEPPTPLETGGKIAPDVAEDAAHPTPPPPPITMGDDGWEEHVRQLQERGEW